MGTEPTKPLLRALAGTPLSLPPWWLMRQAGRYLPEYRQVRTTAKNFIDLCLNPSLSAELTLQPIRRYGMDGAILFSDILMIPHALGQNLTFLEGEGPVLKRIESPAEVAKLDPRRIASILSPVFEAVGRIRGALDARTTLIGFAGAPWTVATYMVEGRGTRDFRLVKTWAYRDPQGFDGLIELLVESTIDYLAHQIEAGAEVVQLFDSWAGMLPEQAFARWVIEPTRRIVAALKVRFPDCPVIGFPRGAGVLHKRYLRETRITGISFDTGVPPGYARETLQPHGVVQGNLDPVMLIAGGTLLEQAAQGLRRMLGGRNYIFNLGHGVLPETPPENIQALSRLLAEPIAC